MGAAQLPAHHQLLRRRGADAVRQLERHPGRHLHGRDEALGRLVGPALPDTAAGHGPPLHRGSRSGTAPRQGRTIAPPHDRRCRSRRRRWRHCQGTCTDSSSPWSRPSRYCRAAAAARTPATAPRDTSSARPSRHRWRMAPSRRPRGHDAGEEAAPDERERAGAAANHACASNCSTRIDCFHGGASVAGKQGGLGEPRLRYVAVTTLAAGKVLTICYAARRDAWRVPSATRRTKLAATYCFTCNCALCAAPDTCRAIRCLVAGCVDAGHAPAGLRAARLQRRARGAGCGGRGCVTARDINCRY